MKPGVMIDYKIVQENFDQILDECELGAVFEIYLEGKPMVKMMPATAEDVSVTDVQ